MTNSKDFASFIDDLRESRNIPRDEFVHNIISMRQYYRFISGESSLKNETINLLLDRLEITTIEAYESYRNKNDSIREKLFDTYKLIYKRDYEKANELFKTINRKQIENNYNKKFYNFLSIFIQVNIGLLDKEVGVERTLKLIDYPNILNKEVLSFVEFTCILFVQDSLFKKGDERIASFSYKLLSKDPKNEIYSNYRLGLQFSTIKNLGAIGEYEKSYELSLQAIEEFETHNALNMYASAYFFKALNERNLFDDDRYRKTLTKLFSLLHAQTNQKHGDELKASIKRVFDLEESDLIEFKV